MTTLWTLRIHHLSPHQPPFRIPNPLIAPNGVLFVTELTLARGKPDSKRLESGRGFVAKAVGGPLNTDDRVGDDTSPTSRGVLKPSHLVSKFRGFVGSVSPVIKTSPAINRMIGLCAAVAVLIIAFRAFVVRKTRYSRPGSVADLVRRGQLRSDRRGISKALKYEDPFNNPFVKIGKSSSTIEMCGKIYRLAPVTLTKEEQAIHQKRRSRAYQWKRPKVFLKEGDTIPPDVDPDTVRWIPANHPFATTGSEIDEDLAQNNVYQKHGVPFRLRAEHEALQRKLEARESEGRLDKLVIDSGMARESDQKFKLSPKSNEPGERVSIDNQSFTDKSDEIWGTNMGSEDK